jgi:eukaryotic-like serine/threonine-protein kinase
MTANPPHAGDAPPPIYNGRYELRNQIARGGTAQVYLARDLLLDRPVALKVLFPELSSDSSFVERFRREAQAAANLSHPNIVPVFDWGESERTYFIVMEHVDGEPLSAIIRGQAPLAAMRAAAIAGDIAKALSYAHRHGVVHRDVKPGNVLITRDGQVKVADFGIARAVGADDSVTQTGLVMGTATYFSPEQAQGLNVDGRSDVYSLGVVLYEMVTGRAPFTADTPVAIAYKHVSETPAPPREVEPRVPASLEAVILRAMAKNPADRYATAEDLHADLQRFAAGVPVLAPQVIGDMLTQAIRPGLGSETALLQPLAGAAGATVAMGAAGGAGMSAGQQALQGGPPGLPSKPVMPKRRWIPWTVVGILLVAALVPLAEYGSHKLGYFGAEGYFYMPPLTGRSLQAAETILSGDGLIAQGHAEHSPVAKFQVISTVPTRAAQVQKGQTVQVVYSLGPVDVRVPYIRGDSVAVAEAALRKDNLKFRVHPVTVTLGEQTGVVSGTDPPVNALVPPETTVVLTVPTGVALVTVPKDLTGKSVSFAQNAILNDNLKLSGQTTSVLSPTVKAGLVTGTSPPEGSKTTENTPVTIFVSLGPGDTVPFVVGKTANAAENAITTAGLAYLVQYKRSTVAQENIVLSQSPTSGQVQPGSNVTITVGQGPLSSVTVKNPGPQTTVLHGPANLQIVATDSAGRALTYMETGLPPGLAINVSTGDISGQASQPGKYSVTVTATDSTGATGSTTFIWTVKHH